MSADYRTGHLLAQSRQPGPAADGPTEGKTRMNSTDGTKVLVRSRKGRMVAGICAGAAGFCGWALPLVRVVGGFLALLPGGPGPPRLPGGVGHHPGHDPGESGR